MIPNTVTAPVSQYPMGSQVGALVADPAVSGTIYALTNGNEFFKSVDFGNTWTQIAGPGLKSSTTGAAFQQNSILSIHVDPLNPLTWSTTPRTTRSMLPPARLPMEACVVCSRVRTEEPPSPASAFRATT